jgi:hypothetical protein
MKEQMLCLSVGLSNQMELAMERVQKIGAGANRWQSAFDPAGKNPLPKTDEIQSLY